MNLGQVRFRIVLGQYGLPAGQPTPECLYDEQFDAWCKVATTTKTIFEDHLSD